MIRFVGRRPAALALALTLGLLLSACSTSEGGSGTPTGSPAPSTSSSRPTPTPSTTVRTVTVTPPPPVPPVKTTTVVPPRVTAGQRAAALAALAPNQHQVLVTVVAGFEAATWNQTGDIEFWSVPPNSTAWRKAGSSRYPWTPALGSPPDASVLGQRLANMQHATYIVHALLSGDGSGNAVAYTTGTSGWGAIKAEPNGNIGPSGRPVGSDQIGLSYDFAFVNGDLETKDCSANLPISDCDTNPVVKLWAWTGRDFAPA